MIRDEIQIGLMLRVITKRWDKPIGTLAKVDALGWNAFTREWWFTVLWLVPAHGRLTSHSLNLFEADLPTFEIYRDRLPLAQRPLKPARIKGTNEQQSLPFGEPDE
ncbi:MAG: hypothetical protein QM771_16155 [Nitrospira sp.]